MKTPQLFAFVTPGAIDYLKLNFTQKNKADYLRLKKIFDTKKFEAKSFADSDLDLLTFDWKTLEKDRNWWWQLQALPFLNWYVNSWELQTHEERSRYYSLCCEAILLWIKYAKSNDESPLAWHDHATAFRVRNIVNWLVFCQFAGMEINKDNYVETFANLVLDHLAWLHEDVHYSKHTNHGFDQAMIVLTITSMFEVAGFEIFRDRSRDRLKEEISFAFTEEGVHKENSPGYQKMMLGRLKQLRALALLGEKDVSTFGEKYIAKAETFLRVITLPNTYLPMIGDTRGNDEGLRYEAQDKVNELDYSKSGYVVIRGLDESDKEFFLLLKNTHESNYHRHDDDMMIYLYYDGEVVLGDGGLYKHQEKNDKRKVLRSYLSHNVPFIDGLNAIRQKEKLDQKPTIKRVSPFQYEMTSYMFGRKLKRTVHVSFFPALSVQIKDEAEPEEEDKVWSNFFLENFRPFQYSKDSFQVYFDRFILFIGLDPSNNGRLSIRSGWSQGRAVISRSYATYEPALAVSIQGVNKTVSFKFEAPRKRNLLNILGFK
jgi:hypothetical protein